MILLQSHSRKAENLKIRHEYKSSNIDVARVQMSFIRKMRFVIQAYAIPSTENDIRTTGHKAKMETKKVRIKYVLSFR